MTPSKALFGPLVLASALVSSVLGQVRLNELMAVNDDTVADELGEYDDWIELVNIGDDAVDLAGYRIMGLRDGETGDWGGAWALPATSLDGGARVIIWADGEPDQGPLHASFRLSGAGESVVLWGAEGAVVDSTVFGALAADRAYARIPDRTGSWELAAHSSPGGPNPALVWQPWSRLHWYGGGALVLLVAMGLFGVGRRTSPQGGAPQARTRKEVGRLAGSIETMAGALNRATAALGVERERLGTIVEGMLEGVAALDESDRVTLANSRFRRYLELDEALLGARLADCAAIPELLAVVQEARARAGSSDEEAGPVAARAEFDILGGTPRRVLVRAVPIRDTGGVVVVVRDLTELRRLESVRRDFVANVSHELRTPVSVIRANAETLVDGALDDREDAASFAGAILSNAERLSTLIADLLDLSRLDAGSYRVDRAPVEVSEIVYRVLEMVESPAKGRSIQCLAELEPGLHVEGDARALEQVLFNLVENAVKYNSDGGRVVVRVSLRGRAVRIEVEDDGAGVPEEHRERVFERFYRVDTSRSRELGGTGLGLAIVKHLAESMGGSVGVRPMDPKGAVFWVELGASG